MAMQASANSDAAAASSAPPFTLKVTSPVIYWLRGLIVHAPNVDSLAHVLGTYPVFQPLFKGTTVEALKEVRVRVHV